MKAITAWIRTNLSDWEIRALKTFVQSFFGVLVPELCIVLNGGFTDLATAWKILAPVVAAALSAAIAAFWNICLERLKAEK